MSINNRKLGNEVRKEKCVRFAVAISVIRHVLPMMVIAQSLAGDCSGVPFAAVRYTRRITII